MRTCGTLWSLFLICVVLTSEAHAAQLSQAQVEAVESRYFTRIGPPLINLHNAEARFPDGVKGFTEYKFNEAGWGSSRPYANFSDKGLHARFCASSAVVLATNLSSVSYAAVVFDYLDSIAEPKVLAWVSDRDAMIDRHDGVVNEIATLAFYVLKFARTDGASIATPRLIHTMQEITGVNMLDPLIRMPDYLAGTIADMNLEYFEFSHEKFEAVAKGCLMGQKNHVVARVKWTGSDFTVHRLTWQTHQGA